MTVFPKNLQSLDTYVKTNFKEDAVTFFNRSEHTMFNYIEAQPFSGKGTLETCAIARDIIKSDKNTIIILCTGSSRSNAHSLVHTHGDSQEKKFSLLSVFGMKDCNKLYSMQYITGSYCGKSVEVYFYSTKGGKYRRDLEAFLNEHNIDFWYAPEVETDSDILPFMLRELNASTKVYMDKGINTTIMDKYKGDIKTKWGKPNILIRSVESPKDSYCSTVGLLYK